MQKTLQCQLRKTKLKLTNNSEIYDQYIIVRDQLDEFMERNRHNYTGLQYSQLLNFKLDTTDVYASLNLVYFDNKICKLHNEDPSDRMIQQANAILNVQLPDFLKKYDKMIKSSKKQNKSNE